MNQLNQRGFTVVEGLLIVVAISLLGFGGYYVYNENTQDDDNTTVQNEVEANEQTESDEQKQIVDSVTYSDTIISFTYPAANGAVSSVTPGIDEPSPPTRYEFGKKALAIDTPNGPYTSLDVALGNITIFDNGPYNSSANGILNIENGTFDREQEGLVERFTEDGIDYIFELAFGEGSGEDGIASIYSSYSLHRIDLAEHVSISGIFSRQYPESADSDALQATSDAAKDELKEALVSILGTVELK